METSSKILAAIVVGSIIVIGIMFVLYQDTPIEKEIAEIKKDTKIENDIENNPDITITKESPKSPSLKIAESPPVSYSTRVLAEDADYLTAKKIVNNVIFRYDENNKKLRGLTPSLTFHINETTIKYAFVWEMSTKDIVAHPDSSLIGKNVFRDVITTNEPLDQINSELMTFKQTKITYEWKNPETSKMETKVSYLKLYDGLVFGSGYFLN